MKFNIFRNPFIDNRVSYITESYLRETIANNILKFGAKIESNLPNTPGQISHGEAFLKLWARHITHECADIARNNFSGEPVKTNRRIYRDIDEVDDFIDHHSSDVLREP
jgi:hypothetical protein